MARVVREAIKLIVDPEKNFVVIMKDGKIYKSLVKQPNSQKERTRQ